jgi:serine/threonine protein kinase
MKKRNLTQVHNSKQISSGGFSSVVLGIIDNDDDVIVKLINPSEGNINILDKEKRRKKFENMTDNFSNEKDLVSSLSHKNIIKDVDCELPFLSPLKSEDIDLYEIAKNQFICYEFADQTLNSLIQQRNLSEFYAVYIIRQLSKALSYLHNDVLDRRIIIHGDLKPDNIFIHKCGRVKIGDFGSARMELPYLWTSPKTVTPFYMAPETVQNKIDSSCDIWACGVIFLELLIGSKKLRELLNGENLYELTSSSTSKIIDILKKRG